MAKVIAEFLLVFWLLGMGMHLGGIIHLFALLAVAFLAVDFLTRPRGQRFTRTHPANFL